MSAPRLIICETTGHLAAALRRLRPEVASAWREARSLPECADLVSASPESLVAIEWTDAWGLSALRLITRLSRRYSRCLPIMIAPNELAGPTSELFEEAATIAGAKFVVQGVKELPLLAEAFQRHAAQLPAASLPIARQIWESLPWEASARNDGAATVRQTSLALPEIQ